MNKKNKFIITTDKDTANKLIAEGFRVVTEINGVYTFENKPNVIVFEKIDKTKVVYSNILSL